MDRSAQHSETVGVVTYDDFFAATVPALRRLAVARTGSWAAADDVVQDVMADAFRRWDVIGSYDDPTAWARRAVLNRSVSRWRHTDREVRPGPPADG